MMRNIFYLLFLLLILGCGPSKYNSIRNVEKKEHFTLPKYDMEGNAEIYTIDITTYKNLFNQQDKKFLTIFFAYWCPNCREYLPKILEEAQKQDLNVILISPDDWVWKDRYLNYKRLNQIEQDFFLLDVHEYNKGNIHKKMAQFIYNFCPDCEFKGGFPTVFIHDVNKELIFLETISDENYEGFLEVMREE